MDTNRPGKLGNQVVAWTLEGRWRDADRTLIEQIFDICVPARIDSEFNRWTARYNGKRFLAWRASWEGCCLTAENARELADQIAAYYQGIS
jgi:hypothetical protein